ncbi:MAG: alanine--tRNA ligase [Promethearchaeota archaeon]
MLSDKEQKKAFKEVASRDPEKYYPTRKLRALGFSRKRCRSCGMYFWTVNEGQETCGDPACSGGFNVVEDNPSKVKMSYVDVWKEIVALLEPRGYVPVKRYPVVARWNPTTEFTMASISAFQPYVVNGESEPPAKKLLIPQFCLRFNDIENVGITGSHCTGFVMIGQHVFVSPDEWDQEQLFTDILDFLLKSIRLPKSEVTIHEDAWAGGGSFGPCMEFFSRGVELFNQVYTMYEQTPEGSRDLQLKVLDMGLGMERCAWFSQGTPNMYEAVFPLVLGRLREATGVGTDFELYNRFSRFSAYLNIDEVDDINEAWARVGRELGVPVDELKAKIGPMTAIYSIAEHARALLFAISDGMLPSNAGGGYNLRVIFRRAVGFIDLHGWDVDLADVCEWHAEELREIFPEVSENLQDIRKILDVEREKYEKTKLNARRVVRNLLRKKKEKREITVEELVSLYDSNGIAPEIVKREARELGIRIEVPDDFYNRVVALHDKVVQVHQTRREGVPEFNEHPDTEALYFDDYTLLENSATVLEVRGPFVVLDRTVAYPTSGGQLHDLGEIDGVPFVDVFKSGNLIVHQLGSDAPFAAGDEVTVTIDGSRRKQLAQHHTATHIINAAARDILGNHINQAGAKKTEKRATLDITHYANVSAGELARIEARANEIVEADFPVNSAFLSRREAEKRYGMRIYQGGAVPGNKIRVVEIPGVDVEACGGTHLHSTGEVGRIRVVDSKNVQDGIVRLRFTAGRALEELEARESRVLDEVLGVLGVRRGDLLARARELFEKWKNLQKAKKSGATPDPGDLKLVSAGGDDVAPTSRLLEEVAGAFKVGVDDLPRTARRFLDEWREAKRRVESFSKVASEEFLEELHGEASEVAGVLVLVKSIEGVDSKDLRNLGIKFLKKYPDSVVFLVSGGEGPLNVVTMGGGGVVGARGLHLGNFLRSLLSKYAGKGGGRPDNGQGVITDPSVSPAAVVETAAAELREILSH